jgi:glycosyltransferase involved in cell wall biosynthesis
LAKVQAAAVREGVLDAIRFTSGITDEELSDAMAGATCLVHPSQREGYGLVVVEAARHGTPVVVVDAPDNAAVELIEEGVNGFTSESTDGRDLAQAILRCVNGGPQLRAATRRWYEEARTTRSIQVTARRILEYMATESRGRRP